MSAVFDAFAYNRFADANPTIDTIPGQFAMRPTSTLSQSSRTPLRACLAYVALAAIAGAAETKPSPKLSPEVVITLQIQALSGNGPQPTRIKRCYQFASPANRLSTGPINRFAGMINLPQYAVLLDANHFLVGRATLNGRQAHLLLTVVDGKGNLSLFRCLLSKQTAAPFVDCWMTDTVVRIGEADPDKAPQIPPPQPSHTI